MKTLNEVLAFVPKSRVRRVTRAFEMHGVTISKIVSQILAKHEHVGFKPFTKMDSEYLRPVEEIQVYMRYGHERFGRFGHSHICISNITIPEKIEGKGIFTALLYTLIAECAEQKIILSIENPLEKFFQDFIREVGFVCPNPDHLGLGTYYFGLKDQISDDEFYAMRKENA